MSSLVNQLDSNYEEVSQMVNQLDTMTEGMKVLINYGYFGVLCAFAIGIFIIYKASSLKTNDKDALKWLGGYGALALLEGLFIKNNVMESLVAAIVVIAVVYGIRLYRMKKRDRA